MGRHDAVFQKRVGHPDLLGDHDLTIAYAARTSGDLTTVSAVLVDATGITVTLKLRDWTKGRVRVTVSGTHANTGLNINTFAILVDGVVVKQVDDVIGVAAAGQCLSFEHYVTGLKKGSHVFKLQWKTAAGTATILGGTSGASRITSIVAQEIIG